LGQIKRRHHSFKLLPTWCNYLRHLSETLIKYLIHALHRGLVVIVSANGTKDRGFESRQDVRFLGLWNCSLLINLQCCCVYLSEINVKNTRKEEKCLIYLCLSCKAQYV
jgi:hypothetical protein